MQIHRPDDKRAAAYCLLRDAWWMCKINIITRPHELAIHGVPHSQALPSFHLHFYSLVNVLQLRLKSPSI